MMTRKNHLSKGVRVSSAIVALAALYLNVFAVKNVMIQPSSITFGDNVMLSFDFDSSFHAAKCWLYLDLDQSGAADPADLLLHRIILQDNDSWDQNPVPDQYGRAFDYQEFDQIPAQYIIRVEDGGTPQSATFEIDQLMTSTWISGTVTQPANLGNMVISYVIDEGVGKPPHCFNALTDASGNYAIFVADKYRGWIGQLTVSDKAGIAADWVMPPVESLRVMRYGLRHDIHLHPASAWIYGRVEDEAGGLLPDGYIIAASSGGASETGISKAGWYRIGMTPGQWDVEGDITQLSRDYLSGRQEAIEVTSGDSARVDLVFYSANSTVSGTIFLDGTPYSKLRVVADFDQGYSIGRSDNSGQYEIPVSDQISSYRVRIDEKDIPTGYRADEEYGNVYSDATNIDFHLIPIAGGIVGSLVVDPGDPYPDFAEFMVWGISRDNGNIYSISVSTDGSYQLRIPEGRYDFRLAQPFPPPAGSYSYCWMPSTYDSVEVTKTPEYGYNYRLNYAHARIQGELHGLSVDSELIVSGWEGDDNGECAVAAFADDDYAYELRACEGIWHITPPEVEGYNVNPPSYTIVVADDDSVFSGYAFDYRSSWAAPEPVDPLASEFQLGACFPNPFNSSVVVTYKVPEPGVVTLSACNVLGQRVRQVFRQIVSAGIHQITWTPEDVAAGIYFMELTWKGHVQIAKVMYLR
jgi:hypothetical protein